MAFRIARRAWLNSVVFHQQIGMNGCRSGGIVKSSASDLRVFESETAGVCSRMFKNSRFYSSLPNATPVAKDFEGITINIDGIEGRSLYLDAQATTSLNPHSRTDAYGWESEKAMETARKFSLLPMLNKSRSGNLELPMESIIRPSIGIPPEMLRRSEYRTPIVPQIITPLEIPTHQGNSNKEIQDSPDNPGRIEKQAARLIVIRRRKMNTHKLRKLRKKMKYKWAKLRLRKAIKKEKEYLNSKMELINAARKFDAKEYVTSVIQRAKEEPIPRKWTDPLMPEWFKEQEMQKEAWQKRYQKMINLYLNKGITIDFKEKKRREP